MSVFVDSSILIEYEKQANNQLLDFLLDSQHVLYINPIVVSEYLYKLLGIIAGRSPLALAESKQIGNALQSHDTALFLSVFKLLPIPDEAVQASISLMSKYNLLPNDAIILASCKLQQVDILASYDSDFEAACKHEGGRLIQSVSEFQELPKR